VSPSFGIFSAYLAQVLTQTWEGPETLPANVAEQVGVAFFHLLDDVNTHVLLAGKFLATFSAHRLLLGTGHLW
jgi:hypothetical protein